jgi:hypothetical protein
MGDIIFIFMFLLQMPTKYIRKSGSTRGSWSENALQRAIAAIRNNMGIYLLSF